MSVYLRGVNSATNRQILQKVPFLRSSDNFPIGYVNGGVINVGTGRCVVAHVNDDSDRILAISDAVHSLTVPPTATADETLRVYACSNGSETQFFITEKSDLSDRPAGYDWVSDLVAAFRLQNGQFRQFTMFSDGFIEVSDAKSDAWNIGATAHYALDACPDGILLRIECVFSSGIPTFNGSLSLRFFSPLNLLANPHGTIYAGLSSFDGDLSVEHSSQGYGRAMQAIEKTLYTDSGRFAANRTGANFYSASYYPTARLLRYQII